MQETNEYLVFIETNEGEKLDYSLFYATYNEAKNEAEKRAEKYSHTILRLTIIEVI